METTPQRLTIRDIAAEAGVSTATVSRVLNGSTEVAEPTRAAVLAVVERQQFTAQRHHKRPNRARDLVVVRCAYPLDDYFGVLVSAVTRSLSRHGKRVVLNTEEREAVSESTLATQVMADAAEGAVLIVPPERAALLAGLSARHYPFVVIAPRLPFPPGAPTVSATHLAGARAATEHLLQLGHQHIGVIAGPRHWVDSEARLLGYRAALASSGRLAPEALVRVADEPTVAHGYEAASALLDLPAPPTAIVAFNDKTAIGALEAAARRGLRVPQDLSLVGFDASELSRFVVPRLTSVRQPLEEMARMGVELLVRLINGPEIEGLYVELATELRVGGSTGPPRPSPSKPGP